MHPVLYPEMLRPLGQSGLEVKILEEKNIEIVLILSPVAALSSWLWTRLEI